ncbi:MAG: FtsX-like permease family protein [bacterium]|nr:FtsX-like permease family protein [bacterium]
MIGTSKKPPKIAELIMFIVSRPEERFSVIGDMEEEYNEIISEDGNFRAMNWYWKQIVKASPPFIFYSFRRSMAMFKNYIKTAFRNIKRNKVTSVINIAGLAVGIAFSLLVYLFVNNEYSFDEFHENTDSIYHVWYERGDFKGGHMSIKIYEDYKRLYTEIDEIVRFSTGRAVIKNEELVYKENINFIDPEFAKVFSFPILAGNRENPLHDKNNVVISKEIAEKYFGDVNPIGKTLEIDLLDIKENYLVTAVADNMKDQSSIVFDVLISFEKYIDAVQEYPMFLDNYHSHNPVTFFLMKPNTDVDALREKLLNIDDHIDQGLEKGEKNYRLQNIRDMHLNNDMMCNYISRSDRIYSYILAALSAVVLIIACINFVTLSVGLSSRRFKEVGVRKVIGARRVQLFKQYIGESMLYILLAVVIGLIIANISLPAFNGIAGKNLDMVFSSGLAIMITLLTLILGLFSGGYPAVIQSGFDPVRVFKGVTKTGGKNTFTKGLIVIQFSLSIALIVSTFVFQNQLEFVNSKKLGFNQERVIELALNVPDDQSALIFDRLKNEIGDMPGIVNAGATSTYYGWQVGRGGDFWTRIYLKDRNDVERYAHFNQISYGYLETMNIALTEGRNFSKDFGSDINDAVIVNEAAVRELNLRDPIGKTIYGLGTESQKIIGVVEDFHFGSLHKEIPPLVLALSCRPIDMKKMKKWSGRWPHDYRYAVIKIAEGDPRPILEDLKASWKTVSPGSPFEIKFIDDTIQSYYESDRKWSAIVNYSSIFAVIIACMGLFGLSLVTAQQRIKEIGIRKVMGASANRIVSLVSKDMLILVLVSSVFAWPAAYYVMNRWLQNFAYRIDLSILFFIASALLALMIAAVTISFQTIKVALKNPVDSLRYE